MVWNLATRIKNDLDYVDGLETIEFVTRRVKSDNANDETVYGNIQALPREIDHNSNDMTELDLEGTGRVWHVKKSALDDVGVVPQQGDEIRECDAQGTKWTIVSLKIQTLRTRYRFVCRKGGS